VAKYGDYAVCDLIDETIASGWPCIMFDRLDKKHSSRSDCQSNTHADKAANSGNEAQAWALLHRCICDGGKGFDDLPEDVRSLTTRRQVIEWGMLNSESIQVAASHFKRAYRTKEQMQKMNMAK
jgi:hypothetical protein